uniref:ATP synthase complex subunit 8 n=1 Tax=Cebus capucinus TaxID=9516 RepID=Q8HFX8_CEBCA|nr:ATP synthase 8 [Cebus capucinus]
MPQLDISPWPMVTLSVILTLFYVMQLKMLKFIFHTIPLPKLTKMQNQKTTWELKWTKIYSPLSMYQ